MANTPVLISAVTVINPLLLYVDGIPHRRHQLTSRIGKEPLEDGSEVTDHLVNDPQTLRLTGIVSDMADAQRPAEAWQAILRLRESKIPFRVVTEWEVLNEMVMLSCAAESVGRGMRFEMGVQEIERAAAPVLLPPLPPPTGISLDRALLNIAESDALAALTAATGEASAPGGVLDFNAGVLRVSRARVGFRRTLSAASIRRQSRTEALNDQAFFAAAQTQRDINAARERLAASERGGGFVSGIDVEAERDRLGRDGGPTLVQAFTNVQGQIRGGGTVAARPSDQIGAPFGRNPADERGPTVNRGRVTLSSTQVFSSLDRPIPLSEATFG